MTAWKLPLIVAAIAVPIIAAFLVAGPAVGTAAGAAAAVAILVVAAQQRPRGPIGATPATKPSRRHVLIVAGFPLEEPGAVAALARKVGAEEEDEEIDVLVLAPASIGFLDRWASDVEAARRHAQERLVATVAALAKAGVEAQARVGDEDVVQAVEDQLQSYPADEVILVTGNEEADRHGAEAAEELSSRLRPRFLHLQV